MRIVKTVYCIRKLEVSREQRCNKAMEQMRDEWSIYISITHRLCGSAREMSKMHYSTDCTRTMAISQEEYSLRDVESEYGTRERDMQISQSY